MYDIAITTSRLWLLHFYREQLRKFEKLGMGEKTENDVLITEDLIRVTKDRLNKLSVVYDRSISPQAHKLRQVKLNRSNNGHDLS